tara:strand:+ start:996 stop:1280 length:285 start_codon:yes stop_codon:yes gene_type:complete
MENPDGSKQKILKKDARWSVKRGDLLQHIDDGVFGLLLDGEPVAYDVVGEDGENISYPPRYRIQWEDMSSPCDEAECAFVVVSEANSEKEIEGG